MTRQLAFLILLLSISTTSCVPAWGPGNTTSSASPEMASPLPTPFQPIGSDVQAVLPEASTTDLSPAQLWISPAVPSSLRQMVLASGLREVADRGDADITIDIQPRPGEESMVAAWFYALVVPFPTITDGVQADELRRFWAGQSAGPFGGRPLLLAESTYQGLIAIWGLPDPAAVRIVSDSELLDIAYAERDAWAIIPFESLEPRWKVLTIDQQSPLRNDFNPENYPLTINYYFSPELAYLPSTNRDPSKLTVLVMTGVTALVRATAARMEELGVLFPGRDIGHILRSADLTHISNEIPFASNCPFPNANSLSLQFCSDPDYIALLEDIGTDIVELTGNHFQDYGSEATLLTLDMYDQRGWPYYGGGRNLRDSLKAITLAHNGNQFAFIGCNPVGPGFAWATSTQPGAAPCNDYGWMVAEINRLEAEGYLVVATLQYNEYYIHTATETQVRDFGRLADAGAVIVSGSQAHFPQAMTFWGDSFIHYGLGNLFFDQMDIPVIGTRREFVDRHVFYDGHHISTELLTFMLEDYARPRPMTDYERRDLLEDIFAASGW
ncbi:MAG: CapA family protein [Chloroflexota bacterium]